MAFGILTKDQAGTPISQNYVPGVGFVALKGSTNTNTDGSSNTSSAAAVGLDQSFSLSATLQNVQAGNSNGTVFSLLGMASVVLTVNMSGFTGTINFEGSEDNTNYSALLVNQLGTNTIGTTAVGSTTTSIVLFEASCANLQAVRARTSGVSAGTVTITAHAIPQALVPRVVNANILSGTSTIGGVELVDSGGTNKAAIDAAGNQWVRGGFAEQAGLAAGSLNADLVASTDVSAYVDFTLTVSGTWSGTLTVQFSNDNSNFTSSWVQSTASSTWNGGSITANGQYYIPRRGRYLRIRMTSYTSGTANGVLEQNTIPSTTGNSSVSASQSGTWTMQPGNTPNTTPWLITFANNNASVPTGAANTVIKNAAGSLATLVVTTTGSGAGNVQLFDNASTNSGTVLFAFPANATAGTSYQVYGWAKNGITAQNVANGPVFTVFYA